MFTQFSNGLLTILTKDGKSEEKNLNKEQISIIDDKSFEFDGKIFTFEHFGDTSHSLILVCKDYPRAWIKLEEF